MVTVSPSPSTYADLIREGRRLLSDAGIANAAQEVRWLLERGLDVTDVRLHAESDRPVSLEARDRALTLLLRRAAGEPLQYLLGTQEFRGLEFEVGPEALIPRPETELLVEELCARPIADHAPYLADIGTGTGCIAVALAVALPHAAIYATDCSAAALRLAQRNARRHDVAERVRFSEGDLLAPLTGLGLEGRLAAVVSNPPYIPEGELSELQREVQREPRLALDGGPDGLTFFRRLLREAWPFLAPEGRLIMEVGQGQTESVCRLAAAMDGYAVTHVCRDDAGIERVVSLQKRVMGDQ